MPSSTTLSYLGLFLFLFHLTVSLKVCGGLFYSLYARNFIAFFLWSGVLLIGPVNALFQLTRAHSAFAGCYYMVLSCSSHPQQNPMPSFVEAAHSRAYSREDLAFNTPISPSTPPELIWDSSSDYESGPTTPISETGLSPPPDDSVHPYQPFWMAPADTGNVFETPLSKNSRRQTGRIPSNLPSIEHVLRDANIPEDRGRRKMRRYLNAHPAKQSRSPVSPDRFIPQREFENSPSTSFQVSKNPRELLPDEKLLRRRSKKVDPFRPARRARSISPRLGPPHVRSPHYSPHLVTDSDITGSINMQRTRGAGRQVSFGAVWNVGGRSAAQGNQPSVAIPDGNGGLLSSGTTAPMHIAEFFSRPTLSEAPERHESRLAVALEIDLASRLLNTCNLSPPSESTSSPSSPGHDRFSPSVWKDGAWIRTDGGQSKFKYSTSAQSPKQWYLLEEHKLGGMAHLGGI